MQIRRVTTDNGLQTTNTLGKDLYHRERTLTTKRMTNDNPSNKQDPDHCPVFGKKSKKTLIDIEMDADSDLDEFDETINDVV